VDGLITAIEPQRRAGGRRSNVFLDGRYAFSLQDDLAAALRVGQPLSADAAERLQQQDERARAVESALAFLSYRPRSEREVRDRLARKQLSADAIGHAIARLRQLGLLDDRAFAQYWVEQRQTHRPRGQRLLRQELLQKGIDRELGAAVLEASAEQEPAVEAACRAGRRRARTVQAADEREFSQRLGPFLLRRGFDYEAARTACRRLWRERSEPD
jgi:regulatory protein